MAFAETRAKRAVESQNFVRLLMEAFGKDFVQGSSELGPLLTRRLPTFVSRLNEKSGSCENIAMFFRPKPEVSWVEASIFFVSATEL